jgi:homoaconitase/3-isopropylmalate dehydratase large subunit
VVQANPDYKGVCHVALAQEGHCRPGEVLFGTDSHTCNAGAFGQFATGIGNTDAGFIMGTGQLLIKVSLCWPLVPPIHLRIVKWNLAISVVYFSFLFQKSQ